MKTKKAEELACLVRRHSEVFAAVERADTMIRFKLQPPPSTPPFIGMRREDLLDEKVLIYRQLDTGEIDKNAALERLKLMIEDYYVEAKGG